MPWSMLYVAAYEESKRRCERPASRARLLRPAWRPACCLVCYEPGCHVSAFSHHCPAPSQRGACTDGPACTGRPARLPAHAATCEARSLRTCSCVTRSCCRHVWYLTGGTPIATAMSTASLTACLLRAVGLHLHGSPPSCDVGEPDRSQRSAAAGSAVAADPAGPAAHAAPALPAWGYAACSAGAAAAAALCTQPLDVVKTRLQARPHAARTPASAPKEGREVGEGSATWLLRARLLAWRRAQGGQPALAVRSKQVACAVSCRRLRSSAYEQSGAGDLECRAWRYRAPPCSPCHPRTTLFSAFSWHLQYALQRRPEPADPLRSQVLSAAEGGGLLSALDVARTLYQREGAPMRRPDHTGCARRVCCRSICLPVHRCCGTDTHRGIFMPYVPSLSHSTFIQSDKAACQSMRTCLAALFTSM